jgi:hypothetical protein
LTIDKGTVTGETATDLVHYNSDIYVFYNHSASAGDIAKLELTTDVVDPDWGSTVPTGAAELYSAPHYCCIGSDGVVYFTNGAFAGYLDGTTLSTTCLPFWTDSQAVSVSWNENRVLVAVNRPNITGANFNQSFIVKWDGVNSQWDGDPIDVTGMIGALYTKNGVTFVWWQDGNTTDGYWLGYVNGGQVSPIKRYSGGLPNQAQVGEWEGFLMWLAGSEIMLWGASDADVSVAMSQYASAKYTTAIGAIAAPFGSILIASNNATTGYSLAKLGGYSVTSSMKTKVFSMMRAGYKAEIDMIQIGVVTMSTGASCAFTLYYDQNKSSKSLDTISYANNTTSTFIKILGKGTQRGLQVEDFMLGWNHATGSTSNAVKIKSIIIKGHYVSQN